MTHWDSGFLLLVSKPRSHKTWPELTVCFLCAFKKERIGENQRISSQQLRSCNNKWVRSPSALQMWCNINNRKKESPAPWQPCFAHCWVAAFKGCQFVADCQQDRACFTLTISWVLELDFLFWKRNEKRLDRNKHYEMDRGRWEKQLWFWILYVNHLFLHQQSTTVPHKFNPPYYYFSWMAYCTNLPDLMKNKSLCSLQVKWPLSISPIQTNQIGNYIIYT